MKNRLLAITLAMLMVLGMVPAFASEVTGLEEHWSAGAVNAVDAMGILEGLANDEYDPEEAVTRGDMFKMMDNVMKYQKASTKTFSDLPKTHVHYNTMLKMVEAGIVTGYEDGTMRPDAEITRDEAIVLYARVFGIKENAAETVKFADADKIDDWAKPLVGGMKAAGYVQGYQNNFKPKDKLTIGEVATLVSNLVDGVVDKAGTYKADAIGKVEGNLVINTKDVKLDGVSIDGNLYIAPGVGSGDVTLNNVKVTGTLYIFGGGKDTVYITGSDTDISDIFIRKDKASGEVRVYNSTGKRIGVYIEDGSANVILVGAFNTVNVTAPGVTVTIANATSGGVSTPTTIQTLNILADNVNTTVGAGAKVDKASIDADNTKISGSGTVTEAAFIGGDGNSISNPGTKVIVGEDSGPVKAGNATVQPGKDATIPSSSGGGGGSSNTGNTAKDPKIVGLDAKTFDLHKQEDVSFTVNLGSGSKKASGIYGVWDDDFAGDYLADNGNTYSISGTGETRTVTLLSGYLKDFPADDTYVFFIDFSEDNVDNNCVSVTINVIDTTPIPIVAAELAAITAITVPVAGVEATTTLDVNPTANFTATIGWQGLTDNEYTDNFTNVATVILTAKTGYTFNGISITDSITQLNTPFATANAIYVDNSDDGETIKITVEYELGTVATLALPASVTSPAAAGGLTVSVTGLPADAAAGARVPFTFTLTGTAEGGMYTVKLASTSPVVTVAPAAFFVDKDDTTGATVEAFFDMPNTAIDDFELTLTYTAANFAIDLREPVDDDETPTTLVFDAHAGTKTGTIFIRSNNIPAGTSITVTGGTALSGAGVVALPDSDGTSGTEIIVTYDGDNDTDCVNFTATVTIAGLTEDFDVELVPAPINLANIVADAGYDHAMIKPVTTQMILGGTVDGSVIVDLNALEPYVNANVVMSGAADDTNWAVDDAPIATITITPKAGYVFDLVYDLLPETDPTPSNSEIALNYIIRRTVGTMNFTGGATHMATNGSELVIVVGYDPFVAAVADQTALDGAIAAAENGAVITLDADDFEIEDTTTITAKITIVVPTGATLKGYWNIGAGQVVVEEGGALTWDGDTTGTLVGGSDAFVELGSDSVLVFTTAGMTLAKGAATINQQQDSTDSLWQPLVIGVDETFTVAGGATLTVEKAQYDSPSQTTPEEFADIRPSISVANMAGSKVGGKLVVNGRLILEADALIVLGNFNAALTPDNDAAGDGTDRIEFGPNAELENNAGTFAIGSKYVGFVDSYYNDISALVEPLVP